MGDNEPDPATLKGQSEGVVSSVEPSEAPPAARIRIRTQAFHRAIDGIRELLDVVSPHLQEGTSLFEAAFGDMTPRQRRTALISIAAIAYQPDSPEDDDDPFTDKETELLDDDEEDGDEKGLDEHADLLALMERARAGDSIPPDEIAELVQTEFAGFEQRFIRFQREFHGLIFNPSKRMLLNGSMLVTAVAIFESLLAGLLTEQFSMFPALVDASEPRFSLAELKEFESIEDAVDAAIEARVENLMNEDFDDWEKWFQKQAGTSLSDLSIDRLRVVEAIQRRHLIVHTGGRVTKKYLQHIGAPKSPHVGTTLRVAPSYLERALDELDVLGVALGLTLGYRWVPEESATILNDLNVLAVELLVAGRFRAALKLCQVGRAIDSSDSWVSKALHVNEWIATKQLEGAHTIRSEVETWDVSALAPEFTLAKFALLDDRDSAFAMLPKLIEDGTVTVASLEEWPLLSELREDERYSVLFASLNDTEADIETPASTAKAILSIATEPESTAAVEQEGQPPPATFRK